MAASSSTRQLQRVVGLLKEYLTFVKTSESVSKTLPVVSNTDAAVQAISSHVKNFGSVEPEQQQKSPTHSTNHSPRKRNRLKQSPPVISASKVTCDNLKLTNTHVRSSSVPARRQSSTVEPRSTSRLDSPHVDPQFLTDVKQLPPLPLPKYSTIRVPIHQSSHSVRTVSNKETTAAPGQVKETPTTKTEFPRRLAFLPTSLSLFRPSNQNGNDNDKIKEKENFKPKWLNQKKDVISKASIDARTRHLVRGITCDNDSITLRRLTDLCHHLSSYPQTTGAAVKSGGVGRLLRVLSHTKDLSVLHEARAALALMGHSNPVTGRGARLLTIDGGGVRGLVAIELVRKLEEKTGKSIFEMFDFICGVSTGAIVAVLVGAHRRSPNDCVTLYRQLSERIFTQNALRGATSLVMNSSYYDSNEWNTILQQNMGDVPLLDTGNDENSPKICLVASQAVGSETHAFLFRNYVLPYRVASHYQGTSRAKLWEAVRASAAAPGYFSEFQLGDKVLQDGGILVNNPTAIAVHEARMLWPETDFQCVVSLGTGRCQPIERTGVGAINWGTKLRSVINSATDTEGVHTVLHDLLPGNVYFRFNPNLNDDYSLDEIRPDRLATMIDDVNLYIRRNNDKFEEAAAALNKEKNSYHRAKDYLKHRQLLYGWDV